MLQIKNLCKSFKNKTQHQQILNKIDLDISAGEIIGIAGLNGIGKTTLLKIIFDMTKSDSGEIKIFDINNTNPLSRKNICYLPEKFLPSANLTGYEFLKVFLSFYDKKLNNETKQQIINTANKLYLDTNVLHQTIGKYSKGMGQKLGLLACIVCNAKLLILDEPMSGLDPLSRKALQKVLIDYIKNGNSILLTSHILADIQEICNKICVLHKGQIIFNNKPSLFLQKYNENNIENAFLKCISIEN